MVGWRLAACQWQLAADYMSFGFDLLKADKL